VHSVKKEETVSVDSTEASIHSDDNLDDEDDDDDVSMHDILRSQFPLIRSVSFGFLIFGSDLVHKAV